MIRTPRPLALLAALVSAVALTACGPSWQVIQQSGPPSALAGARTLGVAFDWSKVSLGGRSEAEFLAGKSAEDRAKFEEVKAKAEQGFMDRLPQAVPGVEVVPWSGQEEIALTVEPTMLEQGKYAVFYAAPSHLRANLIFSRDQVVVDEIYVETVVKANAYRPSILQRLGVCGHNLATLAGRYWRDSQTRWR